MKEKKNLGYYAGTAIGVIISLCLSAILVAMTYKVILWII